MSLLLGGGMAVLVLLIFLVFPVALRLFDYRPDLIAESWRYISWVLPAYMLAMVYIPVRNGVIATGSSRWFLTLSLVTLVLNAGASYVLGFGISLGGLTITGMGTSGIALALDHCRFHALCRVCLASSPQRLPAVGHTGRRIDRAPLAGGAAPACACDGHRHSDRHRLLCRFHPVLVGIDACRPP